MTVSRNNHGHIRRLLALGLFGIAALASAQTPATPEGDAGNAIKLGIVAFVDATASGNRTAGMDVGRTMLSEVVRATSLEPRMLAADGAAQGAEMDGEKAVVLGREQHVDLVFLGTVLEAKSEDSNRSGWIPAIKGQSGNISVRRVKAVVTLQGDLYDVASGQRLFSVRVTGNESNNAFGGTAYTSFGSWGNDSYRSFLDSPMGKALQKALVEMTKKVAEARPMADRI